MIPKLAVPATPAAPPLVSLLSSADVIPEAEDRWEAGIAYEPETCGRAATGAFDPTCDNDNLSLSFTSVTDIIDIAPFGIFAGDSCSSFGYAARDFIGRATRKLASCESAKIEAELWSGAITRAGGLGNPYFATDASDLLTSGPVSPLQAFVCLEQALSECNCGMRGMIHATPEVVSEWGSLYLLDQVTVDVPGRGRLTRLVSKLGTIIVPGAGYDGSGPGVAPVPATSGHVWAYATSMVHIRLSPTIVVPDNKTQALNRLTNFLEYRAQRIVVAGFDCCLSAAEINIPTCGIGGS